MKLGLSIEQIPAIGTMSTDEAKAFAAAILDSATPNRNQEEFTLDDKVKLNRLRYNVQSKNSSKAIMNMFYEILLSGEGMSVNGSKWKKHYG